MSLLLDHNFLVVVKLPTDHPLIARCWKAMPTAESWEDILDLLLSTGLRSVPGACIVDRRTGRLVARGELTIDVYGADGSPQSLTTAAAWVESDLSDARGLGVTSGSSAGSSLPLRAGIVPAGKVELGELTGQPESASEVELAPTSADARGSEPDDGESVINDDTLPDPSPQLPERRPSSLRRLFEETRRPEEVVNDHGPGTGPAEPPTRPEKVAQKEHELQHASDLTLPPQRTGPLTAPPADPPALVPNAPRGSNFIASVPDFGSPAPSTSAPSDPSRNVPPTSTWSSNAPPAPTEQRRPGFQPVAQVPGRGSGVTVSIEQRRAGSAGPDGPSVHACVCPSGHINLAYAAACRVCSQQIPPQNPFWTPRPPLGRLVLPGGDFVTLDRGAILGRDPRLPANWVGEQPHLVRIANPDEDISRQHVEIRLEMFQVLVRDLGSQNGTAIAPRSGERQTLRANELVPIDPGTTIILADNAHILYEATA